MRSAIERRSELGPAIAATALPFVLVLYLAIEGGGYDAVIRSEVGIAVWWIVLLGVLVGLMPVTRVSRAGWMSLALLAVFGGWSALALIWTESSEKTLVEVARIGAYLGVFALALSVIGPRSVRHALNGLAAGIALVGLLALLSRIHPSWFPADQTAETLDYARARLNYPVNYWNGLAILIALGVPVLLAIATAAKRTLTQCLATAALPAMALTVFFTLSRGGAIELLIALIAFVALYPRRLELLPTLTLAVAGSAILIVAATQRDDLTDGLSSAAALNQGDEMLAIVLIVCTGVGLLRAAAALAVRHGIGPKVPSPGRPTAIRLSLIVAGVSVAAAIAAGLPSELSESWAEFKRPIGPSDTSERFVSPSGNGRYQYWTAALNAGEAEPLTGVGPGAFELDWAREGSDAGFVRDAHSLYLETLGETGLVGFALVAAFVFGVLAVGIKRTLAAPCDDRRWMAAATAGSVGFAVAAGIDWAWELAVIPVAFFCLAAAILNYRESAVHAAGRPIHSRLLLGVSALVATVLIGVPLAGTILVRGSEDDAAAGELDRALERARSAQEVQPWAASAPLQEAFVLELQGEYAAAAKAATAATRDEPTNWRPWMVLSRVEAYNGNTGAALEAYREAKSLNPRSALFNR